MLRVTVEVVPHGVEARKQDVARIEIVNTGDHEAHPVMGNYDARIVVRRPNGDMQINTRQITDFERMRWNALALLRVVLESLGDEMLEGEHDERAIGS